METKELVAIENPPRAASPGVGARVFQNTVVLLAGRGFNLGLSLVTSVLLARYLGSELLGKYGAIYAYLSLFGWLATFGLDPILGREAAQRREHATSILLTGLFAGLSFALAGTLCALLLAPYFGYTGQLRWLLFIAAIDLILIAPVRIPGIIFQVDLRQWYNVGIGLLRQILWLVALVLLALGAASFFWVIFARMLCGVADAALVLYASFRPGLLSRPWRLLPDQAKAFLAGSFPIALSTFAVNIYNRIDQVMLHSMSSDKLLGHYVIAVNITELFGALPVALLSSLYPVLARAAGDDSQFERYSAMAFRLLMVVVFAVCALLVPVAGPMVLFFYGAEFAPSGALLSILIWSEVAVFFGMTMSHILISRRLQQYLPLTTVVGAAMNVALNLEFIPRWGAVGASWATLISYSSAGILMFLVFRVTRRFAWQGIRIALLPCALALLITAGLHFVPAPFAFKFILALGVYGVGAYATRVIRRSEMNQAWEMVQGILRLRRTETI